MRGDIARLIMGMQTNYYESLSICWLRYRDMLAEFMEDRDYWDWDSVSRCEATKLAVFIADLIRGVEEGMPLMKLNSWLGYIQGFLITWGITTVTAERDFTRPLFRGLDYA